MQKTYHTTYATVKSHSYGGKSWIAHISGVDEKFGFQRNFLRKQDVTDARSNVYRDLEWDVPLIEGRIYEYCSQTSSRQQAKGFWVVEQGQLVSRDRHQVVAQINAVEVQP